jgi:hypothetical protein
MLKLSDASTTLNQEGKYDIEGKMWRENMLKLRRCFINFKPRGEV